MRQALLYGAATAVAVFFIGWSTGMGGDAGPNLAFSLLMGAFAAGLFVLAKRYAGKR